MDRDTKRFYDADPEGYSRLTLASDVSGLRERFTSRLREGARVLDLGCGSGRDTLAFREEGFEVVPVDGSEGMCRVASENTGSDVRCLDFLDLDYADEFDGVWACASLLHLDRDGIVSAMRLIHRALRDGGVLFVSFKKGEYEGYRDGRWYTDLTEADIRALSEAASFAVSEVWENVDPRGTVWVDAIMTKSDQPAPGSDVTSY